MKITKSGLWSDGELLCHLAADGLEALAWKLHRLGGRCHHNGVEAKRQRDARLAGCSWHGPQCDGADHEDRDPSKPLGERA